MEYLLPPKHSGMCVYIKSQSFPTMYSPDWNYKDHYFSFAQGGSIEQTKKNALPS